MHTRYGIEPKATMLSSMIDVTFSVRAETRPGEQVCVVGDCLDLGNWRPQLAKPLNLISKDGEGEIWSRVIKLPVHKELKYRYFIGYLREGENEGEEHDVNVRLWETNILPRTFSLKDYCLEPNQCKTNVAVFGYYNGRQKVDKGWLIDQTEIHLHLHSSPINMWKSRHRAQTYRIKCGALDLRYKDMSFDCEDEESNHDLIVPSTENKVEVSVLDGTSDEPVEQLQFGAVYKENDVMVFRVKSFEPEYVGFQLDFYLHDVNVNNHPKHIGIAYLLPFNLDKMKQMKTVPINGLKHKPIGQLTVDCLIVKPLKDYSCNMSVSYATHWKRDRSPLDVGHRGMGSSYTAKCAAVRENTLASLAEAGGHGADLVEFDVMLSQDRVPIVYHDYSILMTLKKKNKDQMDWFEIPVHDLTLAQLQKLKLHHLSEKNKSASPPSSPKAEDDPLEHQPFPTLRQCLEHIDPHVGFCVEIKYPQLMKTGEMEEGLKHFPECNSYVDTILKEILQHSGSRRIIFSCFEPDVCILLRMKQNKYPVMFLTQGKSERYPWYKDVRGHTTPMGYSFAHSEKLLGVCLHTEDLLKYSEITPKAMNISLVVFCWGDDANDRDNIKTLKTLGVDGIIHDRIQELKGTKENVFKMEHEAKLQLLQEVGALRNCHNSTSGAETASSSPSSSSAAFAEMKKSEKDNCEPGTSTAHLFHMDTL